jgi:hypothetical protein
MSLMVKFQNTTDLFNRAIVARCAGLISRRIYFFKLCSRKRGLCRCAVLIVCVCVNKKSADVHWHITGYSIQ